MNNLYILNYFNWIKLNESDLNLPDELYFYIKIDYKKENRYEILKKISNDLLDILSETFDINAELYKNILNEISFNVEVNNLKEYNYLLSNFIKISPFKFDINLSRINYFYPMSLINHLKFSKNTNIYRIKEDNLDENIIKIGIVKNAIAEFIDDDNFEKIKKTIINDILNNIKYYDLINNKEEFIESIKEDIIDGLSTEDENKKEQIKKSLNEKIVSYFIIEQNKISFNNLKIEKEEIFHSKINKNLEEELNKYLNIDYSNISKNELEELINKEIKPFMLKLIYYINNGGELEKKASHVLANIIYKIKPFIQNKK